MLGKDSCKPSRNHIFEFLSFDMYFIFGAREIKGYTVLPNEKLRKA